MAAPTSDVANDKPTVGYYPWVLVGLLWFCGFFNYADRQSLSAVLPLVQKEFDLSNTQLGFLATAFGVPYALMALFAGLVVDRTSRRKLVVFGLFFWSLICVATGYAWSYNSLLAFRAAEGLGEAFYFPASMTLIATFHGARTRSRAMSLHQTSVYFGIFGGGVLAGYLGDRFGWRAPFYGLGWVGMGYAVWLWFLLKDSDGSTKQTTAPVEADFSHQATATRGLGGWFGDVWEVLSNPAALLLLLVFDLTNVVTVSLFTWLPKFVYEKFPQSLTSAAVIATLFIQGGSFLGALFGGVMADKASLKYAGGRSLVQGLGAVIGAPFVYVVATTTNVPLLEFALFMVGFCKGIYEANIFASMYDVVRPELRGVSAGLMNTTAWALSSLAVAGIGYISDKYGLSYAISLNSGLYGAAGLALIVGAFSLVGPRVLAKPVAPNPEPDTEF